MMIREIFFIGQNRSLISALKKAAESDFQIEALIIRENSNGIKPKADAVQIMLMECDFTCILKKCLTKFILFCRSHPIPCGILRASVVEKSTPRGHNLYILSGYNLSFDQKVLFEKIRSSELPGANPNRFIHPANPIQKYLQVEKEIVEHPEKRIPISALAQSVYISEPWLSSRFKKMSSVGVNSLVQKNVFCHSLWCLISTNKSIKSIAIEHGYRPHSFSRRFTEIFSQPPNIVRTKTLDM